MSALSTIIPKRKRKRSSRLSRNGTKTSYKKQLKIILKRKM